MFFSAGTSNRSTEDLRQLLSGVAAKHTMKCDRPQMKALKKQTVFIPEYREELPQTGRTIQFWCVCLGWGDMGGVVGCDSDDTDI